MNKESILNIFMVSLVAVVVVVSGLMVEINLHNKEVREKNEALERTSTHFEEFVTTKPLDPSSMATEGFIMYKGKMYKTKKDVVAAMTFNVLLPSETKVMVNGRTIRKDGTTRVLKDNEMINLNGVIISSNRDFTKVTIEPPIVFKGKKIAGKAAPYHEFNKEDYDAAVKQNKLIVLYFYADWDLVCKEEEPQIENAFNKLPTDEVVGFRVNYNDSNTDDIEKNLAKEFSATFQHTKVILKSGVSVLKTEDQWDTVQLMTIVNQYL
ncbi:MAG: DUF6799 domain-containing protein [Patescibacteria group bacterium]